MIDRVTENFEAARVSLRRAAGVRKTQYDVKVKPALFGVGDSVYYWYPRRYAGRSPKLQSVYTGPYKVIRIIDSHNLVIQKTQRAKPLVVHRDKLKRVTTVEDDEIASWRDPELYPSTGADQTDGDHDNRVELPPGNDVADGALIANEGRSPNNRERDRRPKREGRRPVRYDGYV
jgi:hypothetical protein